MSAASRRRKRHGTQVFAEKNYRFFSEEDPNIIIPAKTLHEAKMLFQEKYGYWPEKELNYGNAHPSHPDTPEDSGREGASAH